MLKRSYRLRKDRDFQKLYKSGQRYSTSNFTLHYLASKLEYSKVGFVVSKKVSKSAVIRNKLRRRSSAVVESIYPSLKQPYDIIVLIRRDFSALSTKELQDELHQLFKKISI